MTLQRTTSPALVLLLIGIQPTTVQEPQVSDSWGQAVDGVQLRLAVSANPLPALGELPLLEVQLRNQGPGPMVFIGEAIGHPEVEIDGVWYVQAWAGSCCAAPREIPAGGTSEPSRVRVIPAQTFALNVRPARTLDVKPGRHSVRLRTVTHDMIYVQRVGSRRIVLTSNTITFEVAARLSTARSVEAPLLPIQRARTCSQQQAA